MHVAVSQTNMYNIYRGWPANGRVGISVFGTVSDALVIPDQVDSLVRTEGHVRHITNTWQLCAHQTASGLWRDTPLASCDIICKVSQP